MISLSSQPGSARTNLQTGQTGVMHSIIYPVLKQLLSHSADVGATYQLYAATAPNVYGGEYYQPKRVLVGEVVRSGLNARARDVATAQRLWQISEQLTDVQYAILDRATLVPT